MKPQVDLFSFVFWKKLKTPKRHFKINWPLKGSQDFVHTFTMASYQKWDVKNGFPFVLQFFSLISDGLGGVKRDIWNVSAKSLFVNKQKFKSNLHNVCLIRKGLDESFELPCLFLVKCAASQILNELPKQRNTKEPNPMKNSRKQNPWKQWAMHFPWWWPLCRYFLPFSFWF